MNRLGSVSWLGRDFDEFTGRRRRRDGLPVLLKPLQVELDCLMDQGQDLFTRFARSDAAGKIGNISPERGGALFDNYQVAHSGHSDFLRPACFSALPRVPGGTSTLGFPATVTVPDFSR